jgi:peptidoglycan hydrolase CwlO-like protein
VKRISLVTIILLVISVAVFAQQAGGPPQTAEVMSSAQQTLSQGKTNSSQFESTLADLKARNTSNLNADTYNRLKSEIEQLEFQINVEQTRIRSRLDRGTKVNPAMFDRVQRLIDQHKAKLDELERFTAG